ncbi:MAG TPA: TetR/AcrR family transcriptional regulator [Thermodesulfobacteriota bacterium]|nr:TetR family transcriptional regulator [Deltaproteobacteria bacterium]HNR14679.1 TetR/AcrR family transcriptional regulator [Thermodesulfobacteriota bacterium]HNU72944.1 TetR/AcrR family transcriptional regulator [Thermodesulfobacteriota bacterium]HOC37983.1 TetR/AcrR family transcriptional regulator [Thermodesulfobacteriota bacterium]HQO77677.1 TetR/AcrR family transcriptional regulator [Thermodesulfobacteriota bacterium]
MSTLSGYQRAKSRGGTAKAQGTKDLLRQEAIDLFYEHGYSRTPIRKITESLHVENTIIYYYYKSKDELLFSIIDTIADDLINDLQDIVERVDDPLERLRQMIYMQIVIFKHRKKEVKIFVEDNDKLPPHLHHKIQERQRRIYDIYSHQIKRLLRLGTVKDIEPSVIIFSLFGMINWIYRWFNEDGPLTIEEVANRTIQIFLSGIVREGDA